MQNSSKLDNVPAPLQWCFMDWQEVDSGATLKADPATSCRGGDTPFSY